LAQLPPLLRHVGRRRQVQLPGGRLKRLDDLPANERGEPATRQTLTFRLPIGDMSPRPGVAEAAAVVAVVDLHPVAALAAEQQPAVRGGPAPRRAGPVRPASIWS